eukprot:856720-Pleurochrysis_carterae.AAC.1
MGVEQQRVDSGRLASAASSLSRNSRSLGDRQRDELLRRRRVDAHRRVEVALAGAAAQSHRETLRAEARQTTWRTRVCARALWQR